MSDDQLTTMASVVGVVLGTTVVLTLIAVITTSILSVLVCKKEAVRQAAEAAEDNARDLAYREGAARAANSTRIENAARASASA
jgi:cell division protein FtsL